MPFRPVAPAFLAIAPLLASVAIGCGSSDPPATHAIGTSSSSSGGGGSGGATSSSSSSGGNGGAGGMDPCATLHASFQKLLDDSLAATKAPGAVLGILTPACGKWVGATGQSTKTEAMKPDDVLRVGSVTKTYVATTVLELVGEGKLTLGDSLEQWLPGFPGGAGITVKELLGHTSGIFNYTDDPAFQMAVSADPMMKWAPQDLVDVAAKNPPYFAPGAGWTYSNTNYILLGMLVEKVTGGSAGKAMRQRLLDPLKLTSTSFDGEEPVAGHLAHGFSTSGADVTTAFDASYAWTAGAMVASASDLLDWAKALYGGSVLDPKLLALMETTVDTGIQPGVSYGLGVFEFDASVALDVAYGHLGDIPGYHSQMFYWPKEKVAVVDIVNSDKGSPNPIAAAVIPVVIKP